MVETRRLQTRADELLAEIDRVGRNGPATCPNVVNRASWPRERPARHAPMKCVRRCPPELEESRKVDSTGPRRNCFIRRSSRPSEDAEETPRRMPTRSSARCDAQTPGQINRLAEEAYSGAARPTLRNEQRRLVQLLDGGIKLARLRPAPCLKADAEAYRDKRVAVTPTPTAESVRSPSGQLRSARRAAEGRALCQRNLTVDAERYARDPRLRTSAVHAAQSGRNGRSGGDSPWPSGGHETWGRRA